MTVTRQQRSEETNGTPNSSPSSMKAQLLQTCLSLFAKELTAQETQFWKEFLTSYSTESLKYAFDNWNRNGRFFPKPKDITELVEAYELTRKKEKLGYPGCDSECKARHEKGYGGNDMVWLFSRYLSERKNVNRALNKREIFALLDELDKWRGKAPEWRHA